MPGNEAEASLILEVAKGQCLAYAPALPEPTEYGPVTLDLPEVAAYVQYTRTGDYQTVTAPADGYVKGTVTFSRTGDVVTATLDLIWRLTPSVGLPAIGIPTYRFAALGEYVTWPDLLPWAAESPVAEDNYGTSLLGYEVDGADLVVSPQTSTSQPTETTQRVSVRWLTNTPATPTVQTIPENYFLAIITQARNIANAGVAPVGGGDFDGSGYGVTTYPLDWAVKQMLRPERGLGAVV